MAYREDFSWASDLEPLDVEVEVRVGDNIITRRLDQTTALNPMGQVQHEVADELGIRVDHVHPVTWRVVRTPTCSCSNVVDPACEVH